MDAREPAAAAGPKPSDLSCRCGPLQSFASSAGAHGRLEGFFRRFGASSEISPEAIAFTGVWALAEASKGPLGEEQVALFVPHTAPVEVQTLLCGPLKARAAMAERKQREQEVLSRHFPSVVDAGAPLSALERNRAILGSCFCGTVLLWMTGHSTCYTCRISSAVNQRLWASAARNGMAPSGSTAELDTRARFAFQSRFSAGACKPWLDAHVEPLQVTRSLC